MEIVLIKTLADVEEAVAKKGKEEAKKQLLLLMESTTSLVDAAAIKAKLLNDLGGYKFLNPSMADRKEAAKSVRRCINSMKDRVMVQLFAEVSGLDQKIQKLEEKAAGPVRHVERTPAQRVGDLVFTLHLDDGPVPNPSPVPLKKDEVHITADEDVELRTQDEQAQLAYLQFNIQALQVQKKVLRAMEQKMNAELDNLLQDTLACSSHLGAGFTDFTFTY